MITDLGRIGRSAELRKTGNGISVFTVPVALEYGPKLQDGKRATQWLDLSVWGKQAESLAQYMTSGQQIFFTASDVHVETFDRKDGTSSAKLVARAEAIKFAGSNKAGATPDADPSPAHSPSPAPNLDDNGLDPDIPF